MKLTSKSLLMLAASSVLASSAAMGQVEIGGRVFVSSTDEVIAEYLGTTASFSSDLFLESPPNGLGIIFSNQTDPVGTMRSLGSFPIGTELVFRMHVNDTGEDFFSGPAAGNPDGQAHARVTYDLGATTSLVEFEDLLNGPFNYNDLSFSLTNTVPAAPSVAPLGAALWYMCRRRRNTKR